MQMSAFPTLNPSLGSPAFGNGQSPMLLMAMMNQMMSTLMAFMSGMMAGNGATTSLPSSAGFGGPTGTSSGLSDFLGGPSSGSPASAALPASAASSQSMGSATEFGKSLAQDAEKNANGPGGWCYKWVGNALRKKGVNVSGASAYMAADQLAKNGKFVEKRVANKDLKNLPAGAVVVWDKGNGHQHGHISIALGDGREASDKIRNQITNYGTTARVFFPK